MTGGPHSLEDPGAELERLAILQEAIRLDVHAEAPAPAVRVAVADATEGLADEAFEAAGRPERTAETDRSRPVGLVDLGAGDAVANEPVVRLALPLVEADPAFTNPLPLALEHDELGVGRLLLDPAGHAEVVGVRVGDDEAPDIGGLAAEVAEGLGHRARGLGGAEAGVEERDGAVGLLEDVGHDEREPAAVHRRFDLMQAGNDLHERTPW